MKKYIIGSTILGILAFLYLISPYYSIYKLAISLREGDRYELENYINFDSVRSALKDQITARMMNEFMENDDMKDSPFAGLAMLIGPKFVSSMLDTYITPSGIAVLIKSGRLKTDAHETPESGLNETKSSKDIDIWNLLFKAKYAFFTNPTTFLVDTESAKFKFKLQDWSWKLSSVYLPADLTTHKPNPTIDTEEFDDTENEKISFKT